MKAIAITLGDPAGIGAEVVFKALQELDPKIPVRIFGDWNYASQSPAFDPELRDRFVDVGLSGTRRVRFGQIDAACGQIGLAAIDAALRAIENGECDALVTAPVHKQAMAAAGSKFPGHTELLAARAGLTRYAHEFAMYFDSPALKVVLLTVHIPLRNVPAALQADAVAALAVLTRREIQKIHNIDPRIGVAGLNPHGGEGGAFGDEEKILADGVNMARQKGVLISGPHSPDTVFLSARRGAHDVVLAIYHDQGLIPVKTLDFEHAVNVTLGLPYLRCSVDHGTAFDLAGQGVADHAPMRFAIEWAYHHRQAYRR